MKSVRPYIVDRTHLHTRKAVVAKLDDDVITIIENKIMNRLYELILINIYHPTNNEINHPTEILKD